MKRYFLAGLFWASLWAPTTFAQTPSSFSAGAAISSSAVNGMFGSKVDAANGTLTTPTIVGGSMSGTDISGVTDPRIPAAPSGAAGGAAITNSNNTLLAYFGLSGVTGGPLTTLGNAGDQFINPTALQVGSAMLNGNLAVYNPRTYGQYNLAGCAAFVANNGNDHAQISGQTQVSAANLGAFPENQSVCVYAENTMLPPLITVTGATTFDATHLYMPVGSPLTAPQVASVKPWMRVYIGPANTGLWVGLVQSVASDGTSLTVQYWVPAGLLASGQTAGTPGTPTNGNTAWIDGPSHIEAGDYVCSFTAGVNPMQVLGIPGPRGFCHEIDMNFDASLPPDTNTTDPRVAGLFVGGPGGSLASGTGVVSSGMENGFVARAVGAQGFVYDPARTTNPVTAFLSKATNGFILLGETPAGVVNLDLSSDGTRFELGAASGGVAAPQTTRFRSSGLSTADATITTMGGSATANTGTLDLDAATITVHDGAQPIGLSFAGAASGGTSSIFCTASAIPCSLFISPAGNGAGFVDVADLHYHNAVFNPTQGGAAPTLTAGGATTLTANHHQPFIVAANIVGQAFTLPAITSTTAQNGMELEVCVYGGAISSVTWDGNGQAASSTLPTALPAVAGKPCTDVRYGTDTALSGWFPQ